MDRRDFLRHGVAATAAVGLLPAAAGLTTEQAGVAPVAAPPPRLRPADSVELAGLTALTAFTHRGQAWTVHEDLRPPQGVLVLACAAGVLELGKRTEAVWGSSDTPYFGMPLALSLIHI